MKVIEEIIINDLIEKKRLSDIPFSKFKYLMSRKALVKAIKRGHIYLNNDKAFTADYVYNGDRITLIEEDYPVYKSYQREIEIIYEDEFIAIINKPAGIDVNGNKYKTIENILLANLKFSSEKDALKKFRPVHRLDNQTSGLLLVAKTSYSLVELSRQFENREISKYYTAVVIGCLPLEGEINTSINGQESLTKYHSLAYFPSLKAGQLSLVKLRLYTGRTHQLRIHLASIGHQILGDKLYGNSSLILRGKGLFLHASTITFQHPATKEELTFEIALPHKFMAHLEREKRRYEKYNQNNAIEL